MKLNINPRKMDKEQKDRSKFAVAVTTIITVILNSSICQAKSDNFFDNHAQGWFWYQDDIISPPEEEATQKHPDVTSAPPANNNKPMTPEQLAGKQVAAFKQAIEDKRNIALASPTPYNVTQYMRIQQVMMQRAQHFGNVWQQVLLNEPSLNYERKFPTSQYARYAQDQQFRKDKEQHIQKLSKEYGLFYFFKGGCPACEGFSPIVKRFAQKYDWDVMAVSVDGSHNPLFEINQPNNGLAEELGIQAVPALVAFHSASGKLIPISYAMESMDKLEDNIMRLTGDAHGVY